ncbi:MAG: amino acid adenylation domain-containing protein [Phycisphaerales bacterium]
MPTVPELLRARVERSPGSPAIIAGGKTLTYGQLWDRAAAVAAALAGHGVGPGSLVAVCVERDTCLVPALLGVLISGAAYIPIDPSFPSQRIAQMLEDASPAAILTGRAHAGRFEVREGPVLIAEDAVARPPSRMRPRRVEPFPAGPDDLAYVIYTSGSTGKPKGVMVRHRGFTNILLSVSDLIGCGGRDRLLAVTTVSFDIAGLDLFMPLLAGGTVVLARREEALDGRLLAHLLDEHRISILQATPATWRMLVDSGWRGRRGLRGMTGAEALPRPLAEALLERTDALWNVYGPTETSIWSTAHRVTSGEGPVPIGRALANTTLEILDEEGKPAEQGELYIGGIGVARGYLNRGDLTAARFVEDPASPGASRYRTGDLCRWGEDGVLMYIGRADHQVKVRGYRVELGDVESVLAGHPAVREVIAGTREEGESRSLVAYATLKPRATLTLGDLRRWATERLPGYMVPTGLLVVDKMPRTPNGKTDRAALAAMAARAPAPAPASNDVPETRDDLELTVLKAFREVLGIGDLGAGDDFFDLGGHSLLAFRAAQLIQERTGRAVDVARLFKHPSAAALANILRSRGGMAVAAATIDLQPHGDRPPLLCVCGLALYTNVARALAPEQPVSAIYVDADLAVFHGADGRDRSLTIERVAERYVEQVRAHRPRGPYRLLGFSMGGAVAFEVARRLIDQGERVDLVVMIDTVLADSARVRPLGLARHLVRRTLGRGPAWLLRKLARTLKPGPIPVDDGPPAHLDEAARQLWAVESRGRAILASYRPRPLRVDALLIVAEDRPHPPYLACDPRGGWGRIVRGTLSVRNLPGDHRDLVASPAVAPLIAREIREHLRPIDEPGPVLDSPRLAAV